MNMYVPILVTWHLWGSHMRKLGHVVLWITLCPLVIQGNFSLLWTNINSFSNKSDKNSYSKFTVVITCYMFPFMNKVAKKIE